MISLSKIFRKNWQSFFVFSGSPEEILVVLFEGNFFEGKFKFQEVLRLSPPFHQKFSPEDFLMILMKQLKKVSRKTKLLLLFSAPFLKSTISSISFQRESPQEPIEKEELENIILSSAWRVYDQERNFISKILKVSLIELVLVFSKIKDPRLEGKNVVSFLGLPGRQLTFTFENTYSFWEWWEELKRILEDWGGEVELIGENYLIFDKVFSLIKKRGFLVEIGEEETRVGCFGNFLKKIEVFDWGRSNLIRTLSKNLSLSFSVAKILEERYQEGNLSPLAFKKLTKLLLPEFKIFFEGVCLAIKELSFLEKNPIIYLTGSLENFPYLLEILKGFSWPKTIFPEKPQISFYTFRDLFREIDFSCPSELLSIFAHLPLSFSLIFSYLYLGESNYWDLNKILKRRVKWLSKVFPKI